MSLLLEKKSVMGVAAVMKIAPEEEEEEEEFLVSFGGLGAAGVSRETLILPHYLQERRS